MAYRAEDRYFFSIQPFWSPELEFDWLVGLEGTLSVSLFRWGQDNMESVAGNGQVGIMLQGPENWKGICYGVVETRETISIHGIDQGLFIRFSPGTFSEICHIPAKLIDPYGMPLEDIFSSEQVALMKDAMASATPRRTLLELLGGWAEEQLPSQEYRLAKQVALLIREKRGQVRVRELENETAYSSRRLQDVLTQQVGIAPKQMSRQVRFQNALRIMQTEPNVSLCCLAQTLGYSDQAHFNKEFKNFSGISPGQLQKEIEHMNLSSRCPVQGLRFSK